jgi:hypothetical protein
MSRNAVPRLPPGHEASKLGAEESGLGRSLIQRGTTAQKKADRQGGASSEVVLGARTWRRGICVLRDG